SLAKGRTHEESVEKILQSFVINYLEPVSKLPIKKVKSK
ncbi:hypothetical protein LEP1GSC044_0667, partial [Leptospira kirschneri serovar Grippotyphosa str. RM52]